MYFYPYLTLIFSIRKTTTMMKPLKHSAILGICSIFLVQCATTPPPVAAQFGVMPGGGVIHSYTLRNSSGMEADVINYGGIMTRLVVPDKHGKPGDILLGFDNLNDYRTKSPYFGAIVGRYGNRIANGQFSLNDKSYKLDTNNDPGGIPCSLHGGGKGFDKRIWTATPTSRLGMQGVRLDYTSQAGEEGYPGTLHVTVIYWLTHNGTLRIEYAARADQDTVANITNHNYYNLAGEGADTVNHHFLTLDADRFTPVNAGLIPTGELKPVAGTPFDFTAPRRIGERLDAKDTQLEYAGGYDHNWVLNDSSGRLTQAGELYEPTSGRVMEIWTTEPGIQFYGGNFLDGTLTGKSGKIYKYRSGLCLETQHFPDSPNQPGFPSTVIRAGETYRSVTEYRFKTRWNSDGNR